MLWRNSFQWHYFQVGWSRWSIHFLEVRENKYNISVCTCNILKRNRMQFTMKLWKYVQKCHCGHLNFPISIVSSSRVDYESWHKSRMASIIADEWYNLKVISLNIVLRRSFSDFSGNFVRKEGSIDIKEILDRRVTCQDLYSGGFLIT